MDARRLDATSVLCRMGKGDSGRMRRDWRKVLALSVLVLVRIGASAGAARQDGKAAGSGAASEAVRMTIDLSWGLTPADVTTPASKNDGVVLELSEGRVVEAISWPPGRTGETSAPSGWGALEAGRWGLGATAEGRVRARVEAPVDAKLIVRGGDQSVSVPIAAVLDKPQHTPVPAPLTVSVERLAWDALTVELGPPVADGVVAAGAEVPVTVGFNILWPEPTEVTIRYSAVLRSVAGGEVVSRRDAEEVLPTNRSLAPMRLLGLRAPPAEGVYLIEVQAAWEPVAREGSRLGRLIRRRKPGPAATSCVRRVSLAVLGAGAAESGPARPRRSIEAEVDSVDLARPRNHSPLATGRSPVAEGGKSAWDLPAQALLEPSRRDRVRGWFLRPGAEADRLEPADSSGFAWLAVGLKVPHPDRPHRLTVTVKGGEPASLGVAMIEAGEARPERPRPRVLLDACASGPPVLENGPALAFSWLVWPGSPESVLLMFNRSPEAAVQLGTVSLTELEDLPGPPALREPHTIATRTLGLYLDTAHALDAFGTDTAPGGPWDAATNLARYLAYCGATAVVAPVSLSDRASRRLLAGQAEEDCTGPDRIEILRRVLERRSCSLWLELSFDGRAPLPGLPAPDSPEAIRRGIVRVDSHGRPADAAYQPLHPDVREAMRRRVAETMALAHPSHRPPDADTRASTGLVIRLGAGPTLLGTPDTGIDDATYARFVRETFSPESTREIPGLQIEDPERFAARLHYLSGAGRMPWLTWRARAIASLYSELEAAAREVAPGAVLAIVTPGLDGGPAGAEARRVDLAGLNPGQAWRSVGLDLAAWPSGPSSPAVFRGVTLSTDALAHDLAISPELDAIVAARPRRGLLLTLDGAEAPPSQGQGPTTIRLAALPLGDGPVADEPFGHALAALDAQWVFLSATAVTGQEERLRRFASVLRALPAWPASPAAAPTDASALAFGTTVRTTSDASQSFLSIANDSPYPIRLACLLEAPDSAVVEDLGRGYRLAPASADGGRNLVLDLLPYDVSAIRVGAPGVRVASLTSYPSEAVLAGMQARNRELSLQLARLNQGLSDGASEPANPGFEPAGEPTRPTSAALEPTPARPAPATAQPAPDDEPLPPLPGPDGKMPPQDAGNSMDLPSVPGGWRVEPGRPSVRRTSTGSKDDPATNPAPGAAAIAIDRSNPHSGRGSLRLSATAVPASLVSASFVPGPQSSLTIQAFVRSEPPGATVRVWIEGQSGGRPYIRRSDVAVSASWEARAVRASDLPPGGLDSARLRFELLTPGVLWIDDLHVGGDAPAKSVRMNAQRTMLAALQAYRERRYADFARLSGSHWVRQSAGSAARLARSTGRRPGGSDTEASALSPDRRLR